MSEGRAFSDTNSPGDASGRKRGGDENGAQPRAKRNRYISIACNECKRRKIKCNGQTPCQRCGNLSLDCLYTPNCCNNNFKDSQEFKQMNAHIASLQEQVDTLFHSINVLRNDLGPNIDPALRNHYDSRSYSATQAEMMVGSPSLNRQKQHDKQPHFQGPTSSAFSFGVAKSSLQTMGITGPEDGLDAGIVTQDDTPARTPPPQMSPVPMNVNKDPIWSLTKDESLRLCQVYEDEMGIMYPVVNIEHTTRHARMLYTFIDAANRSGFMQLGVGGPDEMADEETDILKVVLAIALITEGGGKSGLGEKLFNCVNAKVEQRVLGAVDIKCIKLLALIAMYHFHRDDEGMSWRVVGLTARLCIELGLHRAETYDTMFTDEKERAAAVRLFWSIYVLDRRWSFGTGMPFALQEADLDPMLPKPDESTPYLSAMIAYSNIGSKVWNAVIFKNSGDSNNGNLSTPSQEQIRYLDYQIVQWLKNVPRSLRYIHPSSSEYASKSHPGVPDPNMPSSPTSATFNSTETGSRALYRLRVLLYLRANQMRILIYRPALHSATSILSAESSQFAQTVVAVAKDTIRVLTHLNQTSDVYRAQQMCFNYFLLSALAVLFLAVAHAPAQFSEQCRDEFYMALDLVRGLSANSYVSKRLWRTIRGLKSVGPKLGLYAHQTGSSSISTNNHTNNHHHANDNNASAIHRGSSQSGPALGDQQHDAHSSAAMAMAGLAGHPIDENGFYGASTAGYNSEMSASPDFVTMGTSPNGMANELTNLFEAAGGYAAPGQHGQNGSHSPTSPNGNGCGMHPHHGQAMSAEAMAGMEGGAAWTLGNEDELSRIMKDLF